MESFWHDIRYAWRQLRKSPVFAVTAVLTLGLGLGATATMFNVVHDVLLAPLPYPGPGQLVGIGWAYPQDKPTAQQAGSTADFIAQHSRSFNSVGVAEQGNTGVNLSFDRGKIVPLQVHARRVSAGYLPTLGVTPGLGRTFVKEEDLPHGPHAVVLSHALWHNSFHEDTTILGRAIQLDEEPYTVVGVMPADFSDASTPEATDLWEPLQLTPSDPGYDGDNYAMIARLRPGVGIAAAQAEISTLNELFYKQFPSYRSWTNQAKAVHTYRIWTLSQVLTSNVRASLLAMAGAVVAVLLIACLNLAGLMTTRGSERAGELAVRRALGASRARLLRGLLTEGLLLALFSAVLGIASSMVLTPLLLKQSTLPLPVVGTGQNGETAAFVLLVSLGACLLFSLMPAWHAVGRPNAMALPGRSSTSGDRSQAYLGRVLVVSQVALAMVLLSGAGLLLGTFLKVQSISPGFVPQNLVVGQVTLKGESYATTEKTTQFIDTVLARLEHAPGVSSAAAINGLPLDRGLNIGMLPEGHPELRQTAEFRAVTPAYFHTISLPLLAGRTFTESDTAHSPAVAVINQKAARKWWPNSSPIGQVVRMQGSDPMPMQVVGIVADTKSSSLAEPVDVMIYAPLKQLQDPVTKMVNNWFATSFVLRVSSGAPVARLIDEAVNAADPSMPVAKISTMQGIVDKSVAAPRFFSLLAVSFAGFALLLTILGLFGLLSYQVTQRTRELGLRLALGATRTRLLRSVMQRGFVLTALGISAGCVASLAVPKLVAGVLADAIYTGDDPITHVLASSTAAVAAAALAILAASLLASYLPARRAAMVEPMEALRAE